MSTTEKFSLVASAPVMGPKRRRVMASHDLKPDGDIERVHTAETPVFAVNDDVLVGVIVASSPFLGEGIYFFELGVGACPQLLTPSALGFRDEGSWWFLCACGETLANDDLH